jgi:hypothetical protein
MPLFQNHSFFFCIFRVYSYYCGHTTVRNNLKSFTFWDITPCSPSKVNRRFGGTCRLHLQGQRISQARSQCESQPTSRELSTCRLTFNELHGVISQKIVLFRNNLLSCSVAGTNQQDPVRPDDNDDDFATYSSYQQISNKSSTF